MTRRKKIALVLLALLALSQAPFAYRRYRLGRLAAAVDALNAGRAAAPAGELYDEYSGVFHVHSSLGGHSTGRLEEIVRAASGERLAFVVMTEHPSPLTDTSAATLRGVHDGVLFLNGSELVASDGGRLFVVPGSAPPEQKPPLRELAERAAAEGRLAVVGYPEEVRDLDAGGYDGVEVYNLYTNAKRINYVSLFFDGLWSYWGRPELLFARFYERPTENLRRWDELNAAGARRAYAFAGNDAHANVGLHVGDRTGREIVGLSLDPYERSFRVVRTHVLLERGARLEESSLLAALKSGRSFIAYDLFGDATGFRFEAENGTERRTLGEEIRLPEGGAVKLTARSPVKCRTVFLHDGQVFGEVKDSALAELSTDRRGVYRVEVYLDQLGGLLEGKPWVISNPIFVR
ncbi:MAG TPA: hypothetical protein VF736_01875 [Pyrinomonadaceae bacterium]|jgi:hypothetical protein